MNALRSGLPDSNARPLDGCLRWLALLLSVLVSGVAAQTLGTAFTYQGELRDQGQPASGTYDLVFRLYDAATDGNQLGPVQAANALMISSGVFNLSLDFGDQFTGAPRWLELRVRRTGQPGFVILEPRTAITPAPYAQHADFVADNTIVGASIADDTITASDIQSGAVQASELADGAVDTAALVDANVTTAKLADAAVTAGKLAVGAVGAGQIDVAQVQSRVAGACNAGEAIRSIGEDGTVVCEVFQTAPRVLVRTIDDQPNNVGQFNAIAIGSDGLPIIAYHDATATSLKFARCADVDCNGVVVNTFDNSADTGYHADITIGADGMPVIGYLIGSSLVNRIALCADLECSSATFRQHETASIGNAAGHTGIAIGAGNRPIMSFWDISSRDLVVARCADAVCSLPPFPTVTIAEVGDNGEYGSLAIGSDGLPVISYFGAIVTSLKVVKCTTDNCSGAQIITTLDNTGDVGRFTSLAIGSDGMPVISYVDATNGTLKVAACTAIDCTTSTINTVSDPSNGVGGDTAMAMGSDGLPIISYQNANLASLKVAKCTTPDCSGESIITTIDDPANAVGSFNSIAIGVDGLPIISYYDLTAGALKVAKCMAADCR